MRRSKIYHITLWFVALFLALSLTVLVQYTLGIETHSPADYVLDACLSVTSFFIGVGTFTEINKSKTQCSHAKN